MSWKIEYILLIVLSTVIDYWAGLKMGERKEKADRKKFLVVSIVSNLGILIGFKYINFISESFNLVFASSDVSYNFPILNVLLPVGISFYTFQTLSYSIEVYRGKIKPERHLGKFALYVSFFPQLVAGPIERPGHLIPQLSKNFTFNETKAVSGLKLMVWGYFKKVCIADRLAEYVDIVYNNPEGYYGFTIIIATVFFAFQIYCDFSGYSDIAIGAARIMGIDLMKNFRAPYLSKSVGEFWRRWHISLSFWFRDYVYIPLGGSRVKIERWSLNILITFLLSGLWHGANWTFLIWGGLHGVFLVTAHLKDQLLQKLRINANFLISNSPINILSTFLLVLIGWVFFRANSVSDALLLLENSMRNLGYLRDVVIIKEFDFFAGVLLIVFMMVIEYFHERVNIPLQIGKFPTLLRWGIYSSFLIVILFFGVLFNKQEFIYFQF